MNPKIPLEINQLIQAIESGELALPTMPEYAIRVQRMLDDINVSATQIISAISVDPAFAVQLVRHANSAIYADKPKVDTVKEAVSRLGYRMLRSLIVKVAMAKLSNANHPMLRQYLAEFMKHSLEVATISYVLVQNQKHLNADQAILAGLIHDIGVLPICMFMDLHISEIDEQTCHSIIRKNRGQTGARLLRSWSFAEDLAEIPLTHENLQHETGLAMATYSDVVAVANLLSQSNAKFIAWDNVTFIGKLGLSPEVCREFQERFSNDIQRARTLISAN